MRCLCCGKIMNNTVSMQEKKNGWHNRCVKSFFGTETMPSLDVTDEQLEELANSMVARGLTVPGVQKKLSLHLSNEESARLTIVDYPTGYILKPQTKEYEYLPEFEDLSMKMAEIAGIKVVPHALIKMKNELAYITKRIDRKKEGSNLNMYAMEDFCQLSNRLTQDKYKGSYEACARLIKKYSVHTGLDLSELFIRIVFSFITGNSDMHLKNFSLIETEPSSREFGLSKAYDMLPVNIVLPEDEEQLALTLNGKKKNLRKKDFVEFAEKCDLSDKVANKIIKRLCSMKEKFLTTCNDSYLPIELKDSTKELIEARVEMFSRDY